MEVFDVVVVGGGPGGSAAALAAARSGASVVLLEADKQLGGNAARSTGYVAFADFDMQGEIGADDSPEQYLADMQAEIDRQKHRYGLIFGEPRTGIVEPPLWAAPMVVGINFPAGGFRVNADMQVLDVFGDPIPGLYAVGDCVGGVSPAIGLGGVKITAALTLGHIGHRHHHAPRHPGRGGVAMLGVLFHQHHRGAGIASGDARGCARRAESHHHHVVGLVEWLGCHQKSPPSRVTVWRTIMPSATSKRSVPEVPSPGPPLSVQATATNAPSI